MVAWVLVGNSISDNMKFRIADLETEIPISGDLIERCENYFSSNDSVADIRICSDFYKMDNYPGASDDLIIYLESGWQFYGNLLKYNGMMLHASAVALDGRAYLFSGPCGMGKSTHTRLWQQAFGENAVVFNDDKPALRRLEDRWYAYGTPWCGKDGINVNMKVPLAGICFLKRGTENRIRRLSDMEALSKVISQTLRRFKKEETLNLMLSHTERLIREIPIFELENLPVPDAARLSYETMRSAAKEVGL